MDWGAARAAGMVQARTVSSPCLTRGMWRRRQRRRRGLCVMQFKKNKFNHANLKLFHQLFSRTAT